MSSLVLRLYKKVSYKPCVRCSSTWQAQHMGTIDLVECEYGMCVCLVPWPEKAPQTLWKGLIETATTDGGSLITLANTICKTESFLKRNLMYD